MTDQQWIPEPQPPRPRPRKILSTALWRAMVKAGVLPSDQSVRQFVIVAKDDEAVRLFVEFYGDERMLQVATTLEGITIDSVPAPPDTEEVTP